MNDWNNIFYYSIISSALMLSLMGLWFTAVMPGFDRWSRRFFLCYFIVFLLCCLSGIAETTIQSFVSSGTVFIFLLFLEALFLTIPLPMLTVFLLHCCGETIRSGKLLRIVLGLWIISSIMRASAVFIEGFFLVTPENQYVQGPLYPLLLLPLIAIMLVNLSEAIRRRNQLSCKVFFGFLVAILPFTAALIVQIFVDISPFVNISFVLSALAMYSFILSDQIEQERRHQQELAEQQREIAQQKTRVIALQMRPHFIYNALTSIHGLCRLDPEKARQVTVDFANYLRKNFSAIASENAIPFSTELEHTRAYLAVEQAQHEDMLIVDYDTSFIRFRLPPLTLQPIVENAVKHGIDTDSDPLSISIRTRRSDSGTEIIVKDSGPGFKPDKTEEPGITLNNIRQRLEMMCGGSLTIQPREGGGTVVTVTIPDSSHSD